ncbi:nascent polypeptide-associated complex subunit alpha [Physcia stellaris]|nr:nascent polypeptide-associated complex subunit alpha [Physcia stellaris]
MEFEIRDPLSNQQHQVFTTSITLTFLPDKYVMAEVDISASKWRLVEVGRVVLFTHGKFKDRLATIVEIIDHKRALVDGPSKNPDLVVDRHATALGNVILTPIVIEKLPRAAGRGAVAKAWEKAEVEQKWDQSAWAKRRALREKRRGCQILNGSRS